MPPTDELGQSFSEWQALTDAYAEGLEALLHEEPGAARRLAGLADRLAHYAALFGQDPQPDQRSATAQSPTNQ
ncbi:MAG: hypothetical protein REJ24_12005 [Rhodocyclaceae bacterium]|nr:hypothetical protein [Rhodocyclaceae bacterium]MDQ8000426.1 hypothetical protein [Pseudomonadota bacterium]